jgi:hypothetical protein
MKKILLTLLLLNLIFLDAKPLSFQHHDWQVVCDNTNSCRIAGYSSDESEGNRVSLLFTRKAGKNEPIKGEVQLASAYVEDTKVFKKLPSLFKLELLINGKPPFKLDLITSNGAEYYVDKHMGTISENQKGRGIGDCWSYSSYVWTGKTFDLSSEGTTGLCRVIAGGGAWQLPTFVSKVK